MIYGLVAAIGWGLSDLWAAISGRRIGSFRTVWIAQVAAAVGASVLLLLVDPDLSRLPAVTPWLIPNALVTAAAFAALYRGLELGPIAVVSPVLATYAVVPVLLSVLLLGESLGPIGWAGATVTIAGAVLASSDIRALRAGTVADTPGLPWAVAATILFGVAAYVVGWAAQRAGVLASLWFGKVAMAVVLLVAVVLARLQTAAGERSPIAAPALGLAIAVGLAELVGTMIYARGAEVGLLSIVSAASATYPLLPVIGGILMFHERPAPTQYLGVAMVIGGLVALAFA